MSFDVTWDIEKYKDDHESEEHWQLRKAFMERWKNDYPEERLVCLARVFFNIELMGCRYPPEVMIEVAKLSHEVAKNYRQSRKNKLQRTFVSASDAAEDRAKGIKRTGGVVNDEPTVKSTKINFVRQGESTGIDKDKSSDEEVEVISKTNDPSEIPSDSLTIDKVSASENYVEELSKIKCLNTKYFRENMFQTVFGRMILLIRPWASKLWNIQASCQACNINLQSTYEQNVFALTINGVAVACASGDTKQEAKSRVETLAWNRLTEAVVTVLVKEQFIAQGEAAIGVRDVTGKRHDTFGAPVENSAAIKMMKMMGWKGGGLGADAQGIAEPIKPNFQMVNRAGLGSTSSDLRNLQQSATQFMNRYKASDCLDVDLVFSKEFSKEERAALHKCAQRAGLTSRSYGVQEDRFLVVKKKLDPFSIVRAVLEKGGCTPKYQVFIPSGLGSNNKR